MSCLPLPPTDDPRAQPCILGVDGHCAIVPRKIAEQLSDIRFRDGVWEGRSVRTGNWREVGSLGVRSQGEGK